jgi:hypothetical protein
MFSKSFDTTIPPSALSSSTHKMDGNLLLLLASVVYGLLSLNSSNQTILWPWVVFWQAMLILPMLWLAWQMWHKPWTRFRLGNGLDWLAAIMAGVLLVNTLTAEFPQQAVWYGVGMLGGLAALYGWIGWLTRDRLMWVLKGQAYLALIFVVMSLGLWWLNIYQPELTRLATLRTYGIEQSFDFSQEGLRNWYLLGHQNYVAGYLLLVLPLLIGLALTDHTRQRWLWGMGSGLALINLYTTNSRGGLLGLAAMIGLSLVGLAFTQARYRRWLLPVGLVSGAIAMVAVLNTPRIQLSIAALRRGDATGGQIAYRIINGVVGWNMGWASPLTGQGAGSVFPMYQRFRPFWAGREAELHYQLHSTPVQLWAEFGLWGVLLPLVAAIGLGIALWRQRQRSESERSLPPGLRWSLIIALLSYGVLSLVDYQLDVVAISGVLVIYLAVLCFDLRGDATEQGLEVSVSKRQRGGVLVGVGVLLALVAWLVPVHRAWATSASGFTALQKGDVPAFTTALETSHALAPWEAYYPFMLGWVLGDLSYQVDAPDLAEQLRTDAIAWFQAGNAASPFQEFGHSNLGWLTLPEEPSAAIAEFTQSAQLLPAKFGVFYGLGTSLWLADQVDLAVDAIALEILRNPALIPNWPLNGGYLTELRPAIVQRVEVMSQELLATTTEAAVTNHLQRVRGALRWWTNDYSGAEQDWSQVGHPISRAVLAMAMGQKPDLAALPDLPGKFALQAWQDEAHRRQLLETAWLAYETDLPQLATQHPPEQQIDLLLQTMNEAESFDQWLKDNPPFVELRSERLGFGVLMRHDDGPNPKDFYRRQENLAMSRFFEAVMPLRYPTFLPTLERLLQPYRTTLLEQVTQGF